MSRAGTIPKKLKDLTGTDIERGRQEFEKTKVVFDEADCFIRKCTFGELKIASNTKKKVVRVLAKKQKNETILTAKYHKKGFFRFYYITKTQVKDVSYTSIASILFKMVNSLCFYSECQEKVHEEAVSKLSSQLIKIFNINIHSSLFNGNYLLNTASPLNNIGLVKLQHSLIFPLAEAQVPISKPHKFLRSSLINSTDPKQFCDNFFGHSPKSLVRLISSIYPINLNIMAQVLFIAKVLFPIWPIDKIIELLGLYISMIQKQIDSTGGWRLYSYGMDNADNFNINQWRNFLRKFSCNKIINWYKGEKDRTFDLLKDSINQYYYLKDMGYDIQVSKKMRLREMHDKISKIYRDFSGDNKLLPIYEKLEYLNNKKIKDLHISIPNHSDDLVKIGTSLNNCVTSYAHKVTYGISSIITLNNDNGVPIYCIEMKKNKIIQFLGKNNSLPPKNFKKYVVSQIQKLLSESNKQWKLTKVKQKHVEGEKKKKLGVLKIA